jgi:hypothetical protein
MKKIFSSFFAIAIIFSSANFADVSARDRCDIEGNLADYTEYCPRPAKHLTCGKTSGWCGLTQVYHSNSTHWDDVAAKENGSLSERYSKLEVMYLNQQREIDNLREQHNREMEQHNREIDKLTTKLYIACGITFVVTFGVTFGICALINSYNTIKVIGILTGLVTPNILGAVVQSMWLR